MWTNREGMSELGLAPFAGVALEVRREIVPSYSQRLAPALKLEAVAGHSLVFRFNAMAERVMDRLVLAEVVRRFQSRGSAPDDGKRSPVVELNMFRDNFFCEFEMFVQLSTVVE